MSRHSHSVVLSGVILFVLLFSLACPVTVLAQDGTPPPEATEASVEPPPVTEESSQPTEVPVVQEPAVTESPAAPVAEEAAVIEMPAATEASEVTADGGSPLAELEETGEEVTVSDVLEAAPEGTEVVVLDENGEALPLVSEEAAEIAAVTDPMWCPVIGGVPTAPGGTDCYNFGTSQELIDAMRTDVDNLYVGDSIIYFTTLPTGEFIFTSDGASLGGLYDTTYKGSNLILQGGWSGASGDTNFTQTDFGANRIQIGTDTNPWVGNVTINNITIQGASGTGLTVYTQGNINLDNVTANNNDGDGADLDNCLWDGVSCTSSANIAINDSNFDGNNKSLDPLSAGSGLYIDSGGHVSLDYVSASNNGATPGSAGGNGTQIYDFSSLTIRDSVFNNNYSPVDNYGWGLWVEDGYGDVTLTNVTASGNDNGNPDDEWTGGANIFTDGNVNIDPSEFNDNADGPGLVLLVSGDVTLADVTANGNGLGGANIINLFGSGNVSISSSNFNGNAGPFGLEILVFVPLAGGAVKLDHVSASNNASGDGFILYGPPFGYIVSVVIQDSTFDANGLNGAYLATSGDATLICSQFRDNGAGGSAGEGFGVDGSFVDGTFTLDDVTFSGNLDGDYTYAGTPVITSGGCVVVVPPTPDPTPGPSNELPILDFTGDQHARSKSLPLHIVPVDGGEEIKLDCDEYSGTKLILPNGDQVTLPCPIHDHGVLAAQTAEQLPAPLNAPFVFASALDIQVIRGGKMVDKVNQGMTIDFMIPNGMQGKDFAVLYWDEEQSKWLEVPGTQTGDGRFIASSKFTGVYVLVTK